MLEEPERTAKLPDIMQELLGKTGALPCTID